MIDNIFYLPPIKSIRSISELLTGVNLRFASIVLERSVKSSSSQDPDLLLTLVCQMVAGQAVAQSLPVLGVDESHVLTIQIQSFGMFIVAVVISAVLLFKLVKCVSDMLDMIINEFFHRIHGVDMVYSWPWPSMTVLLEEQIKDVRMVKHFRSKASVGDVIVVVVRSKKSIVSLHLVVNWNRATVFYPQPHCT